VTGLRAPSPGDSDAGLVRDVYGAFAGGDVDGVLDALDPDVEWVEREEFPNGGDWRGRAAVADDVRVAIVF
jgi:ketosteroid isomerase-like protein